MLLMERVRAAARPEDIRIVNTLGIECALEASIIEAGASVVRTPSANPWLAHRGVLGEIRRFQPDVVVVHSPSAAVPLKIARALRRLAVPVVEVIHNTRYRSRAVALATTATNRWADLSLAVSTGAARSRAAVGSRVVQVVHQGIDVRGIQTWIAENPGWRDQVRRRWLAPEVDRVAVFCGRLVAEKRPLDAIKAIDALPRNFGLLVVGYGPETAALESYVRSRGLESRVALLGAQDHAWRFIAAGDVFCLPSAFEGLPVVLMEAVACGSPIAATRIPGVTEIVDEATGSRLFEVGETDRLADLIRELVARDRTPQERAAQTDACTYWDVRTAASRLDSALERVVASA
ncbi:glycosyltransferase [Demequina subtropica]|uniref:glycosyltransferase n=1 Tax=Demequina subtropica TaxID=1638989 RepID=UPI0012E07F31|nr:glycosyltransferase [Demequina subtropica]